MLRSVVECCVVVWLHFCIASFDPGSTSAFADKLSRLCQWYKITFSGSDVTSVMAQGQSFEIISVADFKRMAKYTIYNGDVPTFASSVPDTLKS